MNTKLIKSELESLHRSYGESYDNIMIVLKELIAEKDIRLKSNTYTIDLEGEFIFSGTLEECEGFIKKNRIPMKKNKKDYVLTTPTEDNIVLYYSDEFSHLF